MILTCNSCSKKFVVPDSAITASGRTVQCGSCGNKWKQFPINVIKNMETTSSIPKIVSKNQPVKQKTKKTKKINKRKPREIDLYSPEYLAKKHGIKINDVQTEKRVSKQEKKRVSFGFYNSLLLFLVIIIIFWRFLKFDDNSFKIIFAQRPPPTSIKDIFIFLNFELNKGIFLCSNVTFLFLK